jgi:hypothetical protein
MPKRQMASWAKAEQLGAYRQAGGNRGESRFWYNLMTPHASLAGRDVDRLEHAGMEHKTSVGCLSLIPDAACTFMALVQDSPMRDVMMESHQSHRICGMMGKSVPCLADILVGDAMLSE